MLCIVIVIVIVNVELIYESYLCLERETKKWWQWHYITHQLHAPYQNVVGTLKHSQLYKMQLKNFFQHYNSKISAHQQGIHDS